MKRPATTHYTDTSELTADQAKDFLGVSTREAVLAMIERGELTGARKLEPNKKTSPWLIPWRAIRAHGNYTSGAPATAERGKNGPTRAD